MKKFFGIYINVFFLGLVSLFNDFSAEMIVSVMPAFLISLGAAPIFIGFLEGFADAVASFLKIYSGWLSDKLKKRKIISVLGYSLSVSTRWVLYFVGNIWSIFFLRAIDRIGKGFRESPRDALMAESVPRSDRGRSFGFQRAMDAFGGILGPAIAVLIFPFLGGNYRNLFLIAFVIGIFALLSFLPVKEVAIKEINLKNKDYKKFTFKTDGFTPEFRQYIFSIFIFGLGFMPVSLLLIRILDLGLDIKLMPLVYLIYSSAFAIFAIPFGRLSDEFGEKIVIIGGFASAIIGLLIIRDASSLYALIAGFIFLGIYSAMTNGVSRSLASKLVSEDSQASGQGFLGASSGLSSLFAGLIGGYIWTKVGSYSALNYSIILMILGIWILANLRIKNTDQYNH